MEPIVDVAGLSFTYPGRSRPALEGVEFTVEAGEVFGLLGPSGAGKTTLQRVLTRQLSGASGAVRVFGRSLSSWGRDYFERVGVGFELPNHYLKFTAIENLRFFASLYDWPCRPPEESLAAVGLKEAGRRRVEEFSKGMKMRLNFIRAIQHEPELLFLDEPTAGLDPVHARQIKGIVRDLSQRGVTVILTTHNMTDVEELCDRVAFVSQGRIVAMDRPDALKARYGRRVVEVAFRRDGELVQEEFALDGLGDDARFLERIRTCSIQTMHSREATLDQVFHRLVGSSLEESE